MVFIFRNESTFKFYGIAIKLELEEAAFYDSVHKFPNNSVSMFYENMVCTCFR